MKKSINYWAFPGGLEGTKNIREAMRQARDAGFEAIELCIGDTGNLHVGTTRKACDAIRKTADKTGIEIASCASGVWWGYNFASPRAQDRIRAIGAAKKMLKITGWLGADTLLTIPGSVDVFFDPAAPVVPYDVVMKRATEGVKKTLPTAEKAGVAMAIEPVWNKFLLSPMEMRAFVDSFKSRFVGVYMDVGNVVLYGYPEQWIRILGKRIKRVHLKDFKRAVGTADGFCDLLEGDVNWPEVVAALKEIGYNSYLTAEMIPLYANHPMVRIRNTSAAMDAILGG